jgi:tRNA (mo5U34)-methyltransferase
MRTLQSHGSDEVSGLAPWFHNLHLPGGLQTAPDHPLGDFPQWKWEEIAGSLPEDLSGARALDIGCNAGFYSFELAKRGASVVAIDVDEHYLRQAAWAAGELGLEERIELRRMGVYDLARLEEEFDVVLFLGVLYHLRHPLLAIDIVAERTGSGTLVLQTLTTPGEDAAVVPADLPIGDREALRAPGWPSMAFFEHELAGDPTNWWAPTAGCVEAMLRSAGLEVDARPGHEIWVCRPGERSAWSAEQARAELESATGRWSGRTARGPRA